MNEKHTGNAELCIHMANEFYKVSQSLKGGPLELVHGKIYPCAVNISLACELYMKALSMSYDSNKEYIGVHNLKVLYDDLPEEIRKRIKLFFENRPVSGDSIEVFLDQNKNVFVDWRYTFEEGKGGCTYNYTGFQYFAIALRNEVEKLTISEKSEGAAWQS